MPSPFGLFPENEDEGLNLRLWTGVCLPPVAAGVNVVVGYIVSNFDCTLHTRRTAWIVSILCLLLCVSSFLLVAGLQQRIRQQADDASPSLIATRLFLRHLAIFFSSGFSLIVLASMASTATLGACDL